MKKIYITVSVLIFTLISSAQIPTIQWQKSLGGSDWDYPNSIEQTTDGGYIIAGGSASNNFDVTGHHADMDYWIVKLDGSGSIQWRKSFGGTGWDEANSVKQTLDGGYVVAGRSSSNDGDVTGHHEVVLGNHVFSDFDYWIIKLDGNGIMQWQKSLGGISEDNPSSILQSLDGGYIVSGSTRSNDGDVTGHHGATGRDVWIVKLDSSGIINWQKSLGGTLDDNSASIEQTLDGGYIVAGFSQSNDGDVTANHGSLDVWTVKLSNNGGIQWQKSLGGSYIDFANSIKQTNDAGYIIAGTSFCNNGDVAGHHGDTTLSDYWIIKLDNNGAIQWQESLGGSRVDGATSILQTNDNGYIVAGQSESNDGDVAIHNGSTNTSDYWLIKLDSNGVISWQKTLGGSGVDYANAIQQTTDGGYIVAGYSGSNDGDVTDNHGYDDYWIVKLATATGITELNNDFKISVYPNPANNVLNINLSGLQVEQVSIYNINGQLLGEVKQPANNRLDIANLADGIYIAEVKVKGEVQRVRWVKM